MLHKVSEQSLEGLRTTLVACQARHHAWNDKILFKVGSKLLQVDSDVFPPCQRPFRINGLVRYIHWTVPWTDENISVNSSFGNEPLASESPNILPIVAKVLI